MEYKLIKEAEHPFIANGVVNAFQGVSLKNMIEKAKTGDTSLLFQCASLVENWEGIYSTTKNAFLDFFTRVGMEDKAQHDFQEAKIKEERLSQFFSLLIKDYVQFYYREQYETYKAEQHSFPLLSQASAQDSPQEKDLLPQGIPFYKSDSGYDDDESGYVFFLPTSFREEVPPLPPRPSPDNLINECKGTTASQKSAKKPGAERTCVINKLNKFSPKDQRGVL